MRSNLNNEPDNQKHKHNEKINNNDNRGRMKRTSKILLLLSFCMFFPILTIFIMGVLSGAWFDAEKIMKRPDVEIYKRPMYQYLVYYLTLLGLSIVEFSMLIKYIKNSSISLFRYLLIAITSVIWTIIVLVFIFLT